MKESLFIALYMFFIYVFILFISIITPSLMRKDIVFGVRVPQDKVDLNEIRDLKKKYIMNSIIIEIPIIILFAFLNYNFEGTVMTLFTTFGFIFINFLIYFKSNRAVKILKEQQNWFKDKKQVVVIDINFSKDKINTLVSPWFFIIPIIIILVNIFIGYKYYNVLPARVPTHWNFSGDVTGYSNKSLFLIWNMPMVEIFITFIFFICYKGIGWSKQQISSSDPEGYLKKNKIFRKVWSIYMMVFCIVVNCMFTIGNLQIYSLIGNSSKIYITSIIIFLVIIFSSIIFISVKMGQGGSNIKLKEEKIKNEMYFSEKDDDPYWKFGVIYYNPDDPSVFVEKRFGIGWTINAGSTAGKAIYIGILIFILLSIAIPAISKVFK